MSAGEKRATLRLWLRLLSTSNLIEAKVRAGLRDRFGSTLPRFDLLAQLDHVPEGLTMTELSRRMMVTNGNVTGLVARLIREGLVERRVDAADRRSATVRLTGAGRRAFAAMAPVHADWIAEVFAGLDDRQRDELARLLGAVKRAFDPAAMNAMEGRNA
ncbi:MAG: MarR family transcriptional regulator [Alphaproteobacteria bacterium]|nr:MarR family transcriptional regulator [Alphaproteobacteria bacterium]